MTDGDSYDIKGGTPQARRLASAFASAETALRACSGPLYDRYVMQSKVAGTGPLPAEQMRLSAELMGTFALWMSLGGSLHAIAPGDDLIRQVLAEGAEHLAAGETRPPDGGPGKI